MKQLILLSCLPVLFALTGCKTSKSNAVNTPAPTSAPSTPKTVEMNADASKLVGMSKGACYGRCPVYTMTVLNNGVAQFNGERFCDMLGPHVAQLSSEQLKSLEQHVSGIPIEMLPERFESNVADFPSTEIMFYKDDGAAKNIWWNMDATPKLVDLASYMETYMVKLDWKIDKDAPLPEGAIGNQFLVYLRDRVAASSLAKEYNEYNLIAKKEVTPDQNYWLFEYDTAKISPYEMYNIINKSEKTQSVRFNKKVTER